MKEEEFDKIMRELEPYFAYEGDCVQLMQDWQDGVRDHMFAKPRELTQEEALNVLLPVCKLLNRLFFDYGPDCANDKQIVD